MSHVPAFVHATVFLRQNEDQGDASLLPIWKALFNRWLDIFSFSHLKNNSNDSNVNGNINLNDDQEEDLADADDEDVVISQDANNSDGSNTRNRSQLVAQQQQQEQQHQRLLESLPPPGAILLRLLLTSGSVIPGTIEASPQFKQPRAEASRSQFEFLDESRLRTDDTAAAVAYSQWWEWLAGMKTLQLKFVVAAAVKIGTLFQFVSVAALQSVTRCALIDSALVIRAQSALLAALSRTPVATPLPPPFLLAHLPGLCGATGEAFMDVLKSSSNNNGSKSTTAAAGKQQQQDDTNNHNNDDVDFFSFIVQRSVQVPVSGDLGLELRFLDQTVEDTPTRVRSGATGATTATAAGANTDKHRRRGRPGEKTAHQGNTHNTAKNDGDDDDVLNQLNPPGQASLDVRDAMSQVWTPRWGYGCARFTSLPSRAAAASTAGVSSAVSAAVTRDPLAGVLRMPSYEEPFGMRYVLLLAQRLLSSVGSSSYATPQGCLRLAGRLAFWAATAAASFPLELPAARSSTAARLSLSGGGGHSLSASTVGGVPVDEVSSSGLDSLNELVCVPCMAASLALFCSLKLAVLETSSSPGSQQKMQQQQQQGQQTSAACEALLAVSLACAACSFAASASRSQQAAKGALTLRQVVLATACQWVVCYPSTEKLRAELTRNVVESLPQELQDVTEEKLTGQKKRPATGAAAAKQDQQQQQPAAPVRTLFSFAARNANNNNGNKNASSQQSGPNAILSQQSNAGGGGDASVEMQMLALWAELEATAFEAI